MKDSHLVPLLLLAIAALLYLDYLRRRWLQAWREKNTFPCAWCEQPIRPGDAVSLIHPSQRGLRALPAGAKTFRNHFLCCVRDECGATTIAWAGSWTPRLWREECVTQDPDVRGEMHEKVIDDMAGDAKRREQILRREPPT